MSLAGPESSFVTACRGTSTAGAAGQETLELYQNLVQTLFRLLKNIQLHSMDNQTVQQNLKELVGLVDSSASFSQDKVRLSFIGDSIYVSGRLLYAQRNVYESANELATLVQSAGIHEICFEKDLTEDDLDSFCRAFIVTVVKGREGFLLRTRCAHVEVFGLESTPEEEGEEDSFTEMAPSVLEVLAEYMIDLQAIIDDDLWEAPIVQSRIKSIAQSLVGVVLEDPRSAKALLNCSVEQNEKAHRVLQSGVLSLLVATSFSQDRAALSQLTQASLIARLAQSMKKEGDSKGRPAVTMALGLRFGGLGGKSVERLVAAHGALEMEGDEVKALSIQSQIIRMSLSYVDALSGDDSGVAQSHLDALHKVSQLPHLDTLLLRTLVEVLGIFPSGTILELDSKSWGVVLHDETPGQNLARPRVRLLADLRGNLVKTFKEIKLNEGAGLGMKITGVVDTRNHEFHRSSFLLSEEDN